MFGLSPVEIMIVGAVAVLLFGSRLPSVARSLGKSMTEFKKGLSGIEEDVNTASSSRTSRVTNYAPADDRDEATALRNSSPPTSEPSVSEAAIEKHGGRIKCNLAAAAQLLCEGSRTSAATAVVGMCHACWLPRLYVPAR